MSFIPKEVRDKLRGERGSQLTVISSPSRVTLEAVPKRTSRNLADLISMLKYDGLALSTMDLCQPVAFAEDDYRDSVA